MTKNIRIWVECKKCEQSFQLTLDEEFQKKFKEKATYYPYPILFPHKGHWAVIYLDGDFQDRGTIISEIIYKENSNGKKLSKKNSKKQNNKKEED